MGKYINLEIDSDRRKTTRSSFTGYIIRSSLKGIFREGNYEMLCKF